MNFINKILYNIFSVMILLTITYFLATSTFFYNYEFKKNNISSVTNMNDSQLQESILNITDYLKNKKNDFNYKIKLNNNIRDMYSKKEVSHMKDVKSIFINIKIITSIYFIILIGNYIHMDLKNQSKKYLYDLAKYGFINALSILLLASLAIFINFNQVFIMFHKIFFTNTNWLLNADDMLILQLPEVFFKDISILIVVVSVFINIVFYFIVKKFIKV